MSPVNLARMLFNYLAGINMRVVYILFYLEVFRIRFDLSRLCIRHISDFALYSYHFSYIIKTLGIKQSREEGLSELDMYRLRVKDILN